MIHNTSLRRAFAFCIILCVLAATAVSAADEAPQTGLWARIRAIFASEPGQPAPEARWCTYARTRVDT
jgi:hypothetical protein